MGVYVLGGSCPSNKGGIALRGNCLIGVIIWRGGGLVVLVGSNQRVVALVGSCSRGNCPVG